MGGQSPSGGTYSAQGTDREDRFSQTYGNYSSGRRMSTGKDLEKLEVLLAHWAEHNREHLEEFRKWGLRAEHLGAKETANHLYAAVERMESANEYLSAALDSLRSASERKL